MRSDIVIKEVTKEHSNEYAQIPMLGKFSSKYELQKVDGGLGGILFKEVEIEEYIKDIGLDQDPFEWESSFDLSNWGFFIVYHQDKPVAGITLAFDTEGVNMLAKRKDLTVVWDIRVAPEYKGMGIGSQLINAAKAWAKERNCTQLKIETQNNNVAACKFYKSQGAVLGEINEYAYYGDMDDEVMLIWYIELE
ncbi:GNAT family N-acetyltransferase [Alkaliphilus hydrothermalis]|uniref:Ribosomal protein S18 acetylase RimI-like enzyme n=1 Tax=Alkaliphilus hydrothermalis TaxID=1482730 RepID=A0ABS2NSG5_9FIRM|nr:GNAT family N-acetyltransferase [Alkaliphilus hydrothermalis]MBM7615883.1 ribosomal protein S18 acetylase RimI-like enzyme [Alkaliphilus hydrothermalis]